MVPTIQAQDISQEMTDMHRGVYERELRRPIETEVGELRVCCRLAIELSPADEVLVAHGMHDAVHEARRTFHETLSPGLRAIVEHATGRTVIEHVTHTDLRAHLTIETFSLSPSRGCPVN